MEKSISSFSTLVRQVKFFFFTASLTLVFVTNKLIYKWYVCKRSKDFSGGFFLSCGNYSDFLSHFSSIVFADFYRVRIRWILIHREFRFHIFCTVFLILPNLKIRYLMQKRDCCVDFSNTICNELLLGESFCYARYCHCVSWF